MATVKENKIDQEVSDRQSAISQEVIDRNNAIAAAEKVFGAHSSRAETTVYQAATDGFFMGRILGTNSTSALVRFDIYVETADASPDLVRHACGTTGHVNAQYANGAGDGWCVPVRAGDYYRVLRTNVAGTQSISLVAYWVPLS